MVESLPNKDGPDSDKAEWLCVGVIVGVHGIKGEVRLKSFTGDAAAIADYDGLVMGPERKPIAFKRMRPAKGVVIGTIEGVATRNDAEALKGTELFIRRSDLAQPDEGEFFIADLEGLVAKDGAGARLGVIRSVNEYGAGPLLELALDEPRKDVGRAPVVPFTKALVPEVDIAGGHVTVLLDDWLDGQIEVGTK